MVSQDTSKKCTANNANTQNCTDSITPTAFVVVGMAGSGKTTFVQRLVTWVSEYAQIQKTIDGTDYNKNVSVDDVSVKLASLSNPLSYIEIVNLDPAVLNTKIPASIDIRDHVDIKEIMQKYNMGPNGAISTSINMFLAQIQTGTGNNRNTSNNNTGDIKHALHSDKPYLIVDTPGQIESFIWSAPGDTLMTLLPESTILYCIDATEISDNHYSIISNLVFASAIREKYKKRVILVFTKKDLNNNSGTTNNNSGTAIDKALDYESLRAKCVDEYAEIGTVATYFEEFYSTLEKIEVSAITGEGKKDFMRILDKE